MADAAVAVAAAERAAEEQETGETPPAVPAATAPGSAPAHTGQPQEQRPGHEMPKPLARRREAPVTVAYFRRVETGVRVGAPAAAFVGGTFTGAVLAEALAVNGAIPMHHPVEFLAITGATAVAAGGAGFFGGRRAGDAVKRASAVAESPAAPIIERFLTK